MSVAVNSAEMRPRPAESLATALAGPLSEVDRVLHENLNASADVIPRVSAHLIGAGGKRVRPILTLAAAALCEYDGNEHIKLAAAVEFIHTATLLHDDVVDGSATRRGKPAANRLWGNKPTILVGDFLFSRAFQLMVQTGSIDVLRILSSASGIIAEGEVLQLATANNLKTTEAQHLAVIKAKTAALFEAATEAGAVVSGASPERCEALRIYGDRLGIAFQLADDALDYAGVVAKTGKDAGDDFREGKVTQPVLNAFAAADGEERAFWIRVIEKSDQGEGDLDHALMLMNRHDAVGAALRLARTYADEAKAALSIFPQTALRDDLIALAEYVVDRET